MKDLEYGCYFYLYMYFVVYKFFVYFFSYCNKIMIKVLFFYIDK